MAEETRRKAVMITGATGALGSALARTLAGEDLDLVLLGRRGRALERLQDDLANRFGRQPVICDVDLARLDVVACQALVSQLQAEFGGLDALVHCAADFKALQPLEHVPPADWLVSMQVNLNAPWLLSVACLPLLRQAAGGGRLVFVLDEVDRLGAAYWGPYAVSKGALRTLVRVLAEECEGTGVGVVGFEPGALRSALRSRAFMAEDPEAQPAPEAAAHALADLLCRNTGVESGIYRVSEGRAVRD